MWPGARHRCSTERCYEPFFRLSEWRSDDDFRGYSCDAYPGCSNFTAHGGVWHGASKLCRCAGDVLLKIATPGRECDLADQHRALYTMRNSPCYEKLADANDIPPWNGSDTVLARRTLRTRLVPGQTACTGDRCGSSGGCSLTPQQLAWFHTPGVCRKVRRILREGEAKLLGHDSWPTNFILPSERVASGADSHSPYSRCPVVVIDLTQFIWDVIHLSDPRTGRPGAQLPPTPEGWAYKDDVQPAALRPMPRWFDGTTPVQDFKRRSLNWWPNCQVLQRVFPCKIWARRCSVLHNADTMCRVVHGSLQ